MNDHLKTKKAGGALLVWTLGVQLVLGLSSAAAEGAANPAVPAASGTTLVAVDANPLPQHYIPVLCYHRFGNYGAQDIYSVSMEEFKRQLEIIREEGYTPITASHLLAGWEGNTPLPEKALLITVDDGYKDFRRQAEPLLREYAYPATLFIYTIFIGSRLGLPETALAELQQGGFEIGSHSSTHPKLSKRPAGETEEARKKRLSQELKDSREKLQTWSGGPVIALGYPYGLWDQDTAASAQAAGYQLMFTVNPGTNTSETPRFCLKRSLIMRGMRDTTFRYLLKEKELPVQTWNPELGARTQGPVSRISLILDPRFKSLVEAGSLKATKGSAGLPLTFDAQTGQVDISLLEPWHHGTDLVTLKARAKEDSATYLQSWLMIVDGPENQKGK